MKAIHTPNTLLVFFLTFCLSTQLFGQITVTTKTFNSFKPSKEKVTAIEDGLADVEQQITSKSSSQQIDSDIGLLERMVADIRKDFKRYKKLPGWDEQLASFREQNEVLRQEEEKAAAERRAAAEAERKQKEAARKLKYRVEDSRITSDMNLFKKQPRFKYAQSAWKQWASIEEALNTYTAAYPDDKENPHVVSALETQTRLMGEFRTQVLDFFRPQTTKDQATVAEVWQSKPQNAINILS